MCLRVKLLESSYRNRSEAMKCVGDGWSPHPNQKSKIPDFEDLRSIFVAESLPRVTPRSLGLELQAGVGVRRTTYVLPKNFSYLLEDEKCAERLQKALPRPEIAPRGLGVSSCGRTASKKYAVPGWGLATKIEARGIGSSEKIKVPRTDEIQTPIGSRTAPDWTASLVSLLPSLILARSQKFVKKSHWKKTRKSGLSAQLYNLIYQTKVTYTTQNPKSPQKLIFRPK